MDGEWKDDGTFGWWLTNAIHEWKGQHMHEYGKEPSDADFARKADVPTTSLSVWKSNTRRPTGDNIDKLANLLGLGVYDRLGVNRKMPKSFEPLALLVDQMSARSRKRLLETAQNILDEETESGQNKAVKAT